MMKQLLLAHLFILTALPSSIGQTTPAIGQWRDHVPFSSSFHVVESKGIVHAAYTYGFIAYDPVKKEIERKTRISGLNGSRIIQFAKDIPSDRIAVVYSNYNMDIIDGDKVFNIPDLFLKSTVADKTVNNLVWYNDLIYVVTNLGIIVVDPVKKEVKDTYKPIMQSQAFRLRGIAFLGNDIYVATSEGLKHTSLKVEWPGNFNAWMDEADDVLKREEFSSVLNWQENLIVRKQDSVFIRTSGKWKLLLKAPKPISTMNISGGKLFISMYSGDSGSVLIFSSPTTTYQVINSALLIKPMYCANSAEGVWVADEKNGLLYIKGTSSERIQPDAPAAIARGRGTYFNGEVFAASGSITAAWKGESNPNGFFVFNGNNWRNYNKQNGSLPDSILDVIEVVREPSKNRIYAASYGGGLLEFDNGKIKVYKQGTSIKPSRDAPGSYLVSGLALDQKQNLWVTNYGAEQNLLVKKNDETWNAFSIPFLHAGNAVGKIIIDESNIKWIISPNGNGLFCFDDKGTIDQKNDDTWRYFQQGRGKGNLPSSTVLSIASDRNGTVWVGTDRGIGIIQCGSNVFNSGSCEATLPVVVQDNYNGLLFGEESVNDIAVDGANRKWIATNNGVWLVSADGQKVIKYFNESNSYLLGNQVLQVVIHQQTGEVFFFTNNGICSYVSTATEPLAEKPKPLVFPNPVPPGYSGTIAIRGLNENSWVRIVELDGKLVFQTRSLGGQAIWDGRNYKGEKISSGVYLVMVSNEFNEQQLATKIFFIK